MTSEEMQQFRIHIAGMARSYPRGTAFAVRRGPCPRTRFNLVQQSFPAKAGLFLLLPLYDKPESVYLKANRNESIAELACIRLLYQKTRL